MKTRIIVTAVIKKNGKFLLGRKPKDVGPYPNAWHFLGGGVDLAKESLVDALTREIVEETGMEVKAMEKLGFDEDYEPDKKGEMTHYLFLSFLVTPKAGKISPSDDIITLQWFTQAQLKEIPHTRPSLRLLKRMGLV